MNFACAVWLVKRNRWMEKINLPENLKGKKIKEAEIRTDLGESEILFLTFTDGKILKVSASGCPEFGYALQLQEVKKKEGI
jgi:hypothetical protein